MYDPHADEAPFNPLPPVVVILAMVMAAVELLLQAGESGFVGGAGGVGWRLNAMNDFAFLPAVWQNMTSTGVFPPEDLLRFVTYPFIHGNLLGAIFAIVIVLAIGKAVGEIFSPVAFLAVFFGASIFGAFVYGLLVAPNVPLYGGFPGAYGLIGAFTFLLWVNLAAVGADTRRAFTLIGFLMGIQLVFGLLFGAGYSWIADLSGFVAGFLMSFVLRPGGWSRLLAKIRDR